MHYELTKFMDTKIVYLPPVRIVFNNNVISLLCSGIESYISNSANDSAGKSEYSRKAAHISCNLYNIKASLFPMLYLKHFHGSFGFFRFPSYSKSVNNKNWSTYICSSTIY